MRRLSKFEWVCFVVGCFSGLGAAVIVLPRGKESPEISKGEAGPRETSPQITNAPRMPPPAPEQQETSNFPHSINERTRTVLESLQSLATADLETYTAALKETLTVSDEARRTLHFNLFMETIRPENAETVARIFLDLKKEGLEFHPEEAFFSQRWGEIDPDAALAFVVDGGLYQRDADLLRNVVSGWAMTDPNEAALWVAEQSDGDLRDAALEGAARGWARTDSAGATGFLLAMPESRARDSAAQTIFWQVLYSQGIDAATSWFDSIPQEAGDIRRSVFPLIAERQIGRGIESAAEWVIERQESLER